MLIDDWFTCVMIFTTFLNKISILRNRNSFAIQLFNSFFFPLSVYSLNVNSTHSCILCTANKEETCYHLLFGCNFSVRCWQSICITWNPTVNFNNMIILRRQQFQHTFFMEVFMVAAWLIRKQRNGLIFEGKPPSLTSWKKGFEDELMLQAYRFKDSLKPPLFAWLNPLV
uniref:Uncharacterized protein n=1 Tax=Arundo donax TaxID=35708 RepID=A0A0A9SPA1_ARUDO